MVFAGPYAKATVLPYHHNKQVSNFIAPPPHSHVLENMRMRIGRNGWADECAILGYVFGMTPNDPVHEQFRLVKQQAAALKNLGIRTVCDLLFHFPARYGESVLPKNIAELTAGDTV